MTTTSEQQISSQEIEHVVVLMMENRSFDNVLGGLYLDDSANKPEGWQGLTLNESNPCTDKNETVPVWNWKQPLSGHQAITSTEAFTMPSPNPEEQFRFVHRELTNAPEGTEPKNHDGSAYDKWKYPSYSGNTINMSGFVDCYYDHKDTSYYPQIMHYFTAEDLPVTSALAKGFGVCDRWHASVPTETYPNRLFSLLGHSCGIVNNYQYTGNSNGYHSHSGNIYEYSIFHALDDKFPPTDSQPPNWKIYLSEKDETAETPLETHISYVANRPAQVVDGTQFAKDVTADSLPRLSWYAPRITNDGSGNSNHPPENMLRGEQLILDVYKTLHSSPALFAKTLLIITYDEHGGLYDHISPPSTVSPGGKKPNQSDIWKELPKPNFNFETLGVRVPTLLISPWINKHTLLSTTTNVTGTASASTFDHTCLIKMLHDTFGIDMTKFRARANSAASVGDVFTNSRVNPSAKPNYGPSPDELTSNLLALKNL